MDFPGLFPHFPELFPLEREKWYNGALYGPGIVLVVPGGGYDGRMNKGHILHGKLQGIH